eukprot:TRINITY_DN7185_c2_g1_i2.p4 TRINITY_DN7185_c2_g1~~TRINITY_DN7185_c2_g1_i2.p4  ORF type:complete len:145 (+),score=19.12 TRINITY_DN7185_c2_g1_i2:649-1083(+)
MANSRPSAAPIGAAIAVPNVRQHKAIPKIDDLCSSTTISAIQASPTDNGCNALVMAQEGQQRINESFPQQYANNIPMGSSEKTWDSIKKGFRPYKSAKWPIVGAMNEFKMVQQRKEERASHQTAVPCASRQHSFFLCVSILPWS